MTQLIFRNDLEKNKLDALLHFLKTWNIEAEVKISTTKIPNKTNDFSLASGIWKVNAIDAKELRIKAWNK